MYVNLGRIDRVVFLMERRMNLTVDDLVNQMNYTLDRIDRINRPFYIYVNPDIPQETKDILSEYGIVEDNLAVECGKLLVVKREVIEPPKLINPTFETTTTCHKCNGFVENELLEQIKRDISTNFDVNKMLDKILGKENKP